MDLLVVAIIGFPLYFLFKWISRKYIKQEKNRTIFVAVATPLATILFYGLFVYGILFLITYSPKKDFDRTSWLTEKNTRYQMVDDLINKKLLINSDSTKVKYLIGEPASRDSSNTRWHYNMGTGGGGLGFLFHYLNIKFENNKVDSVQHIEYMD